VEDRRRGDLAVKALHPPGGLAAVLSALALALTAIGCGGDDDGGGDTPRDSAAAEAAALYDASAPAGSDEAAVESSFIAMTEHMQAGEWEQACASMTPRGQRSFAGGQDCAKTLESLITPGALADRPKILAVEVTGDVATIRVMSDNRPREVPYAKRGGVWKVSGQTVNAD
jgi:hypothetical protein